MAGKKKGGVERLGGSPPGDGAPPDYAALLADLKARIGQARMRAALSVNHELILRYWSIGRDISARQTHEGWGAKVIDRLARDIARDFPGMSGLSPEPQIYARLRGGLARSNLCNSLLPRRSERPLSTIR